MKLIYEKTGEEVRVGDTTHINGKPYFVESIQTPHKPGSTGKVYVTSMDEKHMVMGFFPGVVGAVWTGEDGQMKTKTSELTGAALDWAVAKAEGFEPFTDGISWIVDDSGTYKQLPKYSADWAQGGPIIERERIELRDYGGDQWAAYDHLHPVQTGPTPLIAAMRSYAASKLGDEIELPTELKGETQ